MFKEKTEVMILHETLAGSILRDAISFCMVFGVMAVGKWLDSSAMQWVGALMLLLGALNRIKGMPRYTPQEALDLLVKKYGAELDNSGPQGDEQ